MKKNILPIFLCLLTLSCFGQITSPYTVKSDGNINPLLVSKNNSTWVYLLNSLSGAEISYTSPNKINHQWYRYKTGTSGRESVKSLQTGNTSVITDIESDYGYYVDNPEDPKNHYLWIVNYSRYVPKINSITVENMDCDLIKLSIDIDADMLQYYTPTGNRLEIERIYNLAYYTMEWDSSHEKFMSIFKEEKISNRDIINGIITNPSSLQDTEFTFSGDQFAEHFGMKTSMTTPKHEAIAVNAQILVNPDPDSLTVYDNQMTGTESSIPGGTEITFTAIANEAATFYQWNVFNMSINPNQPVSQPTTEILNFTFNEEGQYKVELVVDNRHSSCPYSPDPIEILVSDFALWVPNAFSPTSSPGVNDVFKVAYKSVIDFKGWIFNRWGNEIFYWRDVNQGWDGKYRGKFVPPGTYFYVIEAISADGKKHVRKGDINFVGGK